MTSKPIPHKSKEIFLTRKKIILLNNIFCLLNLLKYARPHITFLVCINAACAASADYKLI